MVSSFSTPRGVLCMRVFFCLPSQWRRYMLVILCIVVAVVFIATGYVKSRPAAPQAGQTVTVVVSAGMTAQGIAEVLKAQGIISNIMVFRVLAKIEGLDSSLQAGPYVFSPAMSIRQIIDMLARGQVAYHTITIPEGYDVEQIAALIENKHLGSAAAFKTAARQAVGPDYLIPRSGTEYNAEGFLFPDTYQVPWGMSERDMVQMMLTRFAREFTPDMRARAAAEGLTVRDVITLASLVEREAKKADERPIIAGVFLRRLQLDMPLQSCATIQYILGTSKAVLSVADTEIPSPYNSYQHTGLPPGPIASPGLASIQAVLNPVSTPYLYFVARTDGSHIFSETYEQHQAAIASLVTTPAP